MPHLRLVLTAGADVQKDRIEVDVWAWGGELESWLVENIVIAGGPEDPAAWEKLTALLGRTWSHESSAIIQLSKLANDNQVHRRIDAMGQLRIGLIRPVTASNKNPAKAPIRPT